MTSTRTALAGAGRQHHRAADDLVGVARVDAEAHRHLDRLVELGERRRPSRGRSPGAPGRRVSAVELLAAARYFFPCVRISRLTVTPIERAAPATMAIALSTAVAVEVRHLDLGDLAHLRLGHRADLGLVGHARPLRDAQLLLEQLGGGRRLEDEGEDLSA
jgi:hypothetical protein